MMDFLAPVSEAAAAEVARDWRAGDGDADMLAVRREALLIDARYRASVPWWDGIDLNEANVRQSVDGRLVLIDLFCLDGAALYGQILKDAAVVRQQLSGKKRAPPPPDPVHSPSSQSRRTARPTAGLGHGRSPMSER